MKYVIIFLFSLSTSLFAQENTIKYQRINSQLDILVKQYDNLKEKSLLPIKSSVEYKAIENIIKQKEDHLICLQSIHANQNDIIDSAFDILNTKKLLRSIEAHALDTIEIRSILQEIDNLNTEKSILLIQVIKEHENFIDQSLQNCYQSQLYQNYIPDNYNNGYYIVPYYGNRNHYYARHNHNSGISHVHQHSR